MAAAGITFQMIDSEEAAAHLKELRALYREVYADPPYEWGDDHAALFAERFQVQRGQEGFALVELLVRVRWRRQHIAQTMHDLLLKDRPEERATLTVLPEAAPAQSAYRNWGWRRVAQKRNPLPGSPLFDVLVKPLTASETE